MSFYKLQERLREEGWYVGWNLPCCQSCAWSELPWKHEEGPFKGEELDFDKVLFNHSQDCEDYDANEPPEGLSEDEEDEWWDNYEMKCLTPDQQNESMFCFSGDEEGTQNLIDILPIIEECGCSWRWDKTGDMRIEISW